MNDKVCEVCKKNDTIQDVKSRDCTSSFISKNSYFSVNVSVCFTCSNIWVEAYYEDFTDVPIENEFGRRVWINRQINQSDLDQIINSMCTNALDIDSFACEQ